MAQPVYSRRLRVSASGLRALLCASLWLSAAAGVAQDAPVVESSPEYTQLVAQAVIDFDAGQFLEARELLARAHALSPNARTLRGMGLAAFEAGRNAMAVSDLSRAVAEQRQALTPPQRAEAEQLLAHADALVARFELLDRPEGATLEVDGEPALLDAEGQLVVEPGRHGLVVRPSVEDAFVILFEAAAGQRAALALRRESEFPPAPAPAPATEAPAAPMIAPPPRALEVSPGPIAPPPAAEPYAERADAGLSLERKLSYAAFSGAAIAGGLALWQWSERESAVSEWNDAGCLARGRTRRANCGRHESAYERAEAVAWITGITSLVLATGGVTLWLLEPERERQDVARCALGLSAISCRVVF